MRSEDEIKTELDRLKNIPAPLPPSGGLYGESYLEALHAITRVEQGARISMLKWILGETRMAC
jgi:hypothetical protein